MSHTSLGLDLHEQIITTNNASVGVKMFIQVHITSLDIGLNIAVYCKLMPHLLGIWGN